MRNCTTVVGAMLLFAPPLFAQPDAFHAVWDSLLQQYVWAGRVHAFGMAQDPRFSFYLDSLATAAPKQASHESQIAFWLNAHNACVVAVLARRPGLRYAGAWDSLMRLDTFCIAGEEHTLLSLRDRLRRFGEPLLHVGASGITMGFPPLARRAFTTANLRRQLRENARAFLRSPRGCILDVETNTLWLSPLFAWYRTDFERGGRTLLHFVADYAEPTVAAYIAARQRELRIDFLELD
ncbi:MAG: DUF547 domain-containing protein, partial [Candidatus Kapabacteria bacterium]|nr:DUF547 domain-containing protein [Candidatus Kapabacteria bacterium]